MVVVCFPPKLDVDYVLVAGYKEEKSWSTGVEEMEIPEVTSSANENVNSEEEDTDDEESTNTSQPAHENDEGVNGKGDGEKVVPETPVNDPSTGPSHVQRNEGSDFQQVNPDQEFSFEKVYSTGDQDDISAAVAWPQISLFFLRTMSGTSLPRIMVKGDRGREGR